MYSRAAFVFLALPFISTTEDMTNKTNVISDSLVRALAMQQHANVSSLEKFLQEPQLGTSWYNPAGPEPTFSAGQTNGSAYEARLGSDALLHCRVTALERDLVTWIKVRFVLFVRRFVLLERMCSC